MTTQKNKKYNTLIIEDELIIIKKIIDEMKNYKQFKLIGTTDSEKKALEIIKLN